MAGISGFGGTQAKVASQQRHTTASELSRDYAEKMYANAQQAEPQPSLRGDGLSSVLGRVMNGVEALEEAAGRICQSLQPQPLPPEKQGNQPQPGIVGALQTVESKILRSLNMLQALEQHLNS